MSPETFNPGECGVPFEKIIILKPYLEDKKATINFTTLKK